MAKMTVNLNGKSVNINTDNPKVAGALAALIEACVERHFPVGTKYLHKNGTWYQLVRIQQANGTFRAYLINTITGRARNSRKVVIVLTDDCMPGGYVTDLPDETDHFFDPENPGQLIQR